MDSVAGLAGELARVLERDERLIVGYLFGSCGRGDAGDASDVDVAVIAREPLSARDLGILVEALEAETGGRRVDLVDLSVAPPLLAAEVVREGHVLLERDVEARFDYEQQAIRRFEDTRYLRRQQQELLRERARHGRQA